MLDCNDIVTLSGLVGSGEFTQQRGVALFQLQRTHDFSIAGNCAYRMQSFTTDAVTYLTFPIY